MSRSSASRGFSDTLLAAVLVVATVIALAIGVMSDARGDVITDLIGDYDLTTGTFVNEVVGSPISGNLTSVVTNGTANFTAGGWSWGGPTLSPGSGLTLSGLPSSITGTTGNYTIGLQFSLGQVDGYRKIIDFNDVDPGQYVFTNQFRFYIDGSNFFTSAVSPTAITTNQPVTFLLTRNGTSKGVNAYLLDGSPTQTTPIVSFTDTNNHATASTTLQFFLDDNGSEYSSSGTVSLIRLWDVPLSAAEIPYAMVPEPATAGLLAVAAAGALFVLRRRHQRR